MKSTFQEFHTESKITDFPKDRLTRKVLFQSFTPKVHFQIFLKIDCYKNSTVPEFYTESKFPDFPKDIL